MRGLRNGSRPMAHLLRLVAFAAALAAGVVGCADTASKADCEKLLDHVIDIEVTAAATGKLTPERKADLEKQKKEVSSYLRGEFVRKCAAETPGSVVQCGLRAKNPEDLARCDQ